MTTRGSALDDDDLDDAFADMDKNVPSKNYNGNHEEEDGNGEGDDDDNYFQEDDFETYGGESMETKLRQSPIIKPTNQQQIKNGEENNHQNKIYHDSNLVDEDENIFEDEQPQSSAAEDEDEGEENAEPNFEQQSMNLESYMEEFFKRKYANHNAESDDKSPDAVDPTGLDGVSPGPGQRHINGTDSPFRFELDCFTPLTSDNIENLADSRTTLANILSKVQDVQTQLIEISTKVDPAINNNGSPVKSSSTKKKAAVAVAVKIIPPGDDHLSPAQDVKIDILKKELRKKTQEIREQRETIETLQQTMMDQANHIHLIEDDLKEERARCNKAIKQKNKSLQTLQKMSQELEKYTAMMNVMNEMKTREELLHGKIKELTLQNHDLTMQLKGSMARELEWRALFRSEQSNSSHPLISTEHTTNQSSRLASHRSLPDNDSDPHLLPKVPYERKSHTERRDKKNKNSGKNLPKIPKKKSEY